MISWNPNLDSLVYCSGKSLSRPSWSCPECHNAGYNHEPDIAICHHIFPFDTLIFTEDYKNLVGISGTT